MRKRPYELSACVKSARVIMNDASRDAYENQ
jgi:hypothetical protein